MSSGNLVSVRSLVESVYGVTPVDSALWEQMRYTSEDLTGLPTTETSKEVRSDRQVSDQFKVSVDVSGGVGGEMSYGTYDAWLAAALAGIWTADVLKAGVVEASFTLEKEYGDLASAQYVAYKGMRVASMAMNIAYGAALTTRFDFAGNNVVPSGTSLVGAGSVIAANANRVINSISDVINLEIDDVAVAGCLTSFSLSVNNSLRPANCVGSDFPSDQGYGTSLITGSMEFHLDGANVMPLYATNVLNQTEIKFAFTLTDGTSSYGFLLPKLKLTGNTPAGGGLDTDVMLSVDFSALHNATEDTALQITRIP